MHDQNQREVADSNRLQSTLEGEEEHESIEGTNVNTKRIGEGTRIVWSRKRAGVRLCGKEPDWHKRIKKQSRNVTKSTLEWRKDTMREQKGQSRKSQKLWWEKAAELPDKKDHRQIAYIIAEIGDSKMNSMEGLRRMKPRMKNNSFGQQDNQRTKKTHQAILKISKHQDKETDKRYLASRH
ncbi:hypothetical protein Tco_1549012 [Tanacetum coccineum]